MCVNFRTEVIFVLIVCFDSIHNLLCIPIFFLKKIETDPSDIWNLSLNWRGESPFSFSFIRFTFSCKQSSRRFVIFNGLISTDTRQMTQLYIDKNEIAFFLSFSVILRANQKLANKIHHIDSKCMCSLYSVHITEVDLYGADLKKAPHSKSWGFHLRGVQNKQISLRGPERLFFAALAIALSFLFLVL